MYLKTPYSDLSYQKSPLRLFVRGTLRIMSMSEPVLSASVEVTIPSQNTDLTAYNDGPFSSGGVSSYAQSFPWNMRRPPSPSAETGKEPLEEAA